MSMYCLFFAETVGDGHFTISFKWNPVSIFLESCFQKNGNVLLPTGFFLP
jgi:hypothetical protein